MPERADAFIEKTEKSPGNLPFDLFLLTIFHAKTFQKIQIPKIILKAAKVIRKKEGTSPARRIIGIRKGLDGWFPLNFLSRRL